MKKIKLSKDQFIEGQVIPKGTEIEIQESSVERGQEAMAISYKLEELQETLEMVINSRGPENWAENRGPKIVDTIMDKIDDTISILDIMYRFK